MALGSHVGEQWPDDSNVIAGKRIKLLLECDNFVEYMEAKGDLAVDVLKAVLEIGTSNLMAPEAPSVPV